MTNQNQQNETRQKIVDKAILIKLGQVCRRKRDSLSMTLTEASSRSLVSREDLMLFESGDLDMDIVSYCSLAQALDTTASQMFEDAQDSDLVTLHLAK